MVVDCRSGNQGEKIWELRNEGETTDMGLWELGLLLCSSAPAQTLTGVPFTSSRGFLMGTAS